MSSALSSPTSTGWCSSAARSSSTARPRSCRHPGTTRLMSILEPEFMRLAFASGTVVGLLAPAVGFFLVQRRLSLIGDGIGHVAFAGVAGSFLLGISPLTGALVASVGGAAGVEWLRGRSSSGCSTARSSPRLSTRTRRASAASPSRSSTSFSPRSPG
ncbi:MAG: hypothetical protein E6G25_08200 [Actinobacteria bacterium]|nr:MAG: hypothetical protein E6G25_08200 [Actinomycetota bacterium]